MQLKGEIQDAVKAAMKSRDSTTLSTLRMLLAAVHNEEINRRRELSDEEIRKTVGTLCKQRQESIALFRQGGRAELATQEEAELEILRRYLPQPLSEDELRSLLTESIRQVGASGLQDLGKVMKDVMPKVSGRSDGKRVNEIAKELLGG
jgi:uncharacterized protein YqeY